MAYQSIGAGLLGIALFFLAAFSSNILLAQASLKTLGITATLSTLALMALLVLILMAL